MKHFRLIPCVLILSLIFTPAFCRCRPAQNSICTAFAKTKKEAADADPSLELSTPSVLLMEAETGTVLYEKKADTVRPPASVTKIMTLILIFDALEKKQIALEDEVTVSENAAAMGGSQVFLEAGEIQTVEDLIKCISIASANDACVAYTNSRHQLLYGF